MSSSRRPRTGARIGSTTKDEKVASAEAGRCIYVIKSRQGDLYKVGVTSNWRRRSRELEVGKKTDKIGLFPTPDNYEIEAEIHRIYDYRRLPQSEWFALEKKDLYELLDTINQKARKSVEAWETKLRDARGIDVPKAAQSQVKGAAAKASPYSNTHRNNSNTHAAPNPTFSTTRTNTTATTPKATRKKFKLTGPIGATVQGGLGLVAICMYGFPVFVAIMALIEAIRGN